MESDILWQIFELSLSRQWPHLLLLNSQIWKDGTYRKWRIVVIHGWRGFGHALRNFTNGEILLLLKNTDLTDWRIKHLFTADKEKLLCLAIPNARYVNVPKLFTYGARYGKLEMLQWTTRKYCLDSFKDHAYDAFLIAAFNGHLLILQWLAEQFNIDRNFVTRRANEIFRYAASNGHLRVLQWLTTEFALTREDATEHHNEAFRYAAGYNHLATLQWITETFQITLADAMACSNHAYFMAATASYTEITTWLRKKFGPWIVWPYTTG